MPAPIYLGFCTKIPLGEGPLVIKESILDGGEGELSHPGQLTKGSLYSEGAER